MALHIILSFNYASNDKNMPISINPSTPSLGTTSRAYF